MYQKRNNQLEVILLYLLDYGKQYYLREISNLTKIPLRTVQTILNILEKNCILKSKTAGKNKYFRLNLDNIQTKHYLLQAEIYKTSLFVDKYPIFKTFMKKVNLNEVIILFGSFAKFSANKDSDLDMLVISNFGRVILPVHLLPYKIHEINMTEITFIKSLEKQEALLKEIEENHIILNGHSFYVNTMWGYYARG
ncbi:MAG: nucleotidyltransferase domain-containing protein [Nanoarchaeota archaeon]